MFRREQSSSFNFFILMALNQEQKQKRPRKWAYLCKAKERTTKEFVDLGVCRFCKNLEIFIAYNIIFFSISSGKLDIVKYCIRHEVGRHTCMTIPN